MSRGWQRRASGALLGARREPAPSSRRGAKRRRAATARAAAVASARRADTILGCSAVMGVKDSSSNGMMSRGWQKRARGARARHAAWAGAELAKGQETSTRSDGAGGSGNVGAEGRHVLGLRRGV